MEIEFIGHAGFSVTTNKLQILVDPWITPSTFKYPVLSSLVPGHQTIDYLIPEPVAAISDFDPDLILISHYHTHHSSKYDIESWLKKSKKKITLIGYQPFHKVAVDFQKYFIEKFPQHTFLCSNHDCSYNFGETEIQCLTNTSKNHFSFFVKDSIGSFLHVADAPVCRLRYDRRLDPLWHKYSRLKPTFMALTVGTTSIRKMDTDGTPMIYEASFMSPVEAAHLTNLIGPKMAAVMGVFNFSAWKNRTEFGFSAYENEAYYRWAVQHLDPTIKVPVLRPGTVLSLNEKSNYAMTFRSMNSVSDSEAD